MKIIAITSTKDGGGFVACVNGFQTPVVIAKDEITALQTAAEESEAVVVEGGVAKEVIETVTN